MQAPQISGTLFGLRNLCEGSHHVGDGEGTHGLVGQLPGAGHVVSLHVNASTEGQLQDANDRGNDEGRGQHKGRLLRTAKDVGHDLRRRRTHRKPSGDVGLSSCPGHICYTHDATKHKDGGRPFMVSYQHSGDDAESGDGISHVKGKLQLPARRMAAPVLAQACCVQSLDVSKRAVPICGTGHRKGNNDTHLVQPETKGGKGGRGVSNAVLGATLPYPKLCVLRSARSVYFTSKPVEMRVKMAAAYAKRLPEVTSTRVRLLSRRGILNEGKEGVGVEARGSEHVQRVVLLVGLALRRCNFTKFDVSKCIRRVNTAAATPPPISAVSPQVVLVLLVLAAAGCSRGACLCFHGQSQ